MSLFKKNCFVIALWLTTGGYCSAEDISMASNDCTATYSLADGKVHIPCISVPNASGGGATVYELDAVQLPLEPSLFALDKNSVKPAEVKQTDVISDIKTMQILLISKLAPGVTVEQTYPDAKGEAELAWQYYSTGRYRQIYQRQDGGGVVAFLESHSLDEAKQLAETMPMVKKHIVEYKLIPFGYFQPFSFLFNTGTTVGDVVNPPPAATTVTRPILIVSHLIEGVKLEDTFPYAKEEAEWAWKYYSTGVYRYLYSRTDQPGVVIVMESKDVDEAKRAVAKMPLVKNKLVEADFIPIRYFFQLAPLFKP